MAMMELTPRDWAIAKGLLRLTSSGAVDYSRGAPIPWQWEGANRFHRWPNPAQDPTFVVSESQFDADIQNFLSLTTGSL